MKFGPVSLAEAEGAILAHSVALENGRLRKGVTLTREHLQNLAAAGKSEIVVARLEPQDVHEDAAARRLADALLSPGAANLGVHATPAATGRVNLIADVKGVAEIDADAVHAINRILPEITIATVPQWHRMDRGGMVATVKIIAYGVPGEALDQACALASGAIRMRPTALASAALVQTVVSGETGDKGHRALQERLQRLGVPLSDKQVVAHEETALAEALRGCTEDVLFILTGSATSDINDVAPLALRLAGGRVDHFGMPVDPGNLLFLGALGDRPVIGLPGCARSPALNGADWVLERILCGVPVSSADIAAMGVGGLLKEIPSRPQPRRSATQAPK